MGFIAMGLMLENYRDPRKRNAAFFYMVAAFLYFYVVVNIIMPSFAIEQRGYLHFQYTVLGKTFQEALLFLVSHPLKSLELLFVSHLPNPAFAHVKRELHFMVLVSGGYCLLVRPQYLLMLLPIYGQKLFSDDVIKWGINYHYSVEFAPILTLALFSVLATWRQEQARWWAAVIACALSVYFSIHKIDRRISPWYDGNRHRFYSPQHYRNENLDVRLAYQVIEKLIPENAVISAHQQVVPHLAFRDKIYLFPDVEDAEYIILLNKQVPYPLSEAELLTAENQLRTSHDWNLIYDFNNMLIFKRANKAGGTVSRKAGSGGVSFFFRSAG